MKKATLFVLILLGLCACSEVETTNVYNRNLTMARSTSKPIYLSFSDNKNASFYFLLSRDTKFKDYQLHVRWHSPQRGELVFNDTASTLKFFVDGTKILTFHPVKRPRIVAYNLDKKGHEEEGIFLLSEEELRQIAYSKNVTAELTGKYVTVTGKFNRHNTMKAFRNFMENSH
jgi:hypothetical protein